VGDIEVVDICGSEFYSILYQTVPAFQTFQAFQAFQAFPPTHTIFSTIGHLRMVDNEKKRGLFGVF